MRVAVTLLLALTSCARGEERVEAPRPPLSPVPRLLVLTGLKGTTEPCGCTSKPLGGLDRVAALVEVYRAAGPAELLLAGDTFFAGGESAKPWAAARTELVASVFARLRPAHALFGSQDAPALPAAGALGLAATRGGMVMLADLRVGVVVAEGEQGPQVQHLRAQGAKLVIALSTSDHAAARAWLAKEPAVDLVIAGGDETPHAPRPDALVLAAGDRGRYLGVLEIHDTGAGAWSYYDAGASQRSSLEARLERLERELTALPSGPARQAREAQRQRLQEQLALPPPPPPAGRYVVWRAEPVTQDLATSPWAASLLAGYNRSLCDIMAEASRDKSCPPAAPGEAYIGSRACFGCHEVAFAVYERTPHAHAWRTLTKRGKACDPGCVGCHSVGYDEPGGYCRLADAGIYQNVGCESCHGPGAAHARAPYQRGRWGERFSRGAGAAACTGCHNPEHSDRFNYKTYLPKILGPGHAARE